MSHETKKSGDGGSKKFEFLSKVKMFFENRIKSMKRQIRSNKPSTQNIISLSAIILIFCYFAYALPRYTPEQIALHSAIIVSMFSVIRQK